MIGSRMYLKEYVLQWNTEGVNKIYATLKLLSNVYVFELYIYFFKLKRLYKEQKADVNIKI